MHVRGIAQSGSAPALGAGCREFKSLYPDQFLHLADVDVAIHVSECFGARVMEERWAASSNQCLPAKRL